MKNDSLMSWSDAALGRVAAGIESVWRAWCAGWGVAPGGVDACNACDVPVQDRSLAFEPLGHDANASIASSSTCVRAGVAALLFGEADPCRGTSEETGLLSREIAGDAIEDLASSIAARWAWGEAAADGPVDVPVAAGELDQAWRRWSGAVLLRLRTEGDPRPLLLLLQVATVKRASGGCRVAPRPSRPLSTVREALLARPLKLRVELDSLALELGALRSLQIGDVLAATHPLDAPLLVRQLGASSSPAVLCAAHLGASAGARAVGLVHA